MERTIPVLTAVQGAFSNGESSSWIEEIVEHACLQNFTIAYKLKFFCLILTFYSHDLTAKHSNII